MRFSCFPFTPEVEMMLRHQELMAPDMICSVISFREDRTQLAEFEKKTGIMCTVSIEEGIRISDALILFENNYSMEWDKYYSCIDYASTQGMPIYATQNLIKQLPDDNRKKKLIRIQNSHRMQLNYLDCRLLNIETPIIAVAGVGENCGKFECQLELKEYLDDLGYDAEWLSSNPLGTCMGMKTLPDVLFAPDVAFPDKVMEFNRYVYDLCSTYEPDVLVIGIPGGILPFSEKETNYFSEIPLVISSALRIDCGILAFYYMMDAQDVYLEQLTQHCLHRFQIHVPILYMSRQMLTFEQEGSMSKHLFLTDEYLSEYPSKLRFRSNIATPGKDNSEVYQSLIGLLQENIETV